MVSSGGESAGATARPSTIGAGRKRQRAQAIEPAAAWRASPGQLAVIALVLRGGSLMHAVAGDIGVGEAMRGRLAMAESHDSRRRHQAKRGKDGNRHRHAKSKPRPKRLQHGSSLVAPAPPGKLAPDQKTRYQPRDIAANLPQSGHRRARGGAKDRLWVKRFRKVWRGAPHGSFIACCAFLRPCFGRSTGMSGSRAAPAP